MVNQYVGEDNPIFIDDDSFFNNDDDEEEVVIEPTLTDDDILNILRVDITPNYLQSSFTDYAVLYNNYITPYRYPIGSIITTCCPLSNG